MPVLSLLTQRRPRLPAPGRIALTALAVLLGAGLPFTPVEAASPLLESVKQNPQLARRLCADLRQLNSRGVSSNSPEAIAMVARSQGLSSTDAEILTTYVVGLHCPDVR
ncbi:hypothetical protein BBFGKLBO_02417 [Synechococcus sp. CBW1107]|uniref:hypothetical protein n=1 Tax=Synechococcus sp. CBW1107 TaxID=2789857 RepID=UPI002AD58530|nr:hypothetical protein [Synechococcus sp. CBW1107]CAK6698253.1 hypothetical protein BBFGKLBO_02417 [Synechococcus sp. CBW1107]